MHLRQLLSYIPCKSIVFAFVLFVNSSYGPVAKNVGFYCNDESIKRPYSGDSISFIVLFTVLLIFYPVIIYCSEVLSRKSKTEEESTKYPLKLLLRKYYSGYLFLLGFTEAIKISVSELRPHFFTTCSPDMENIRCSDGYITQFNCTGKARAYLIERDIYKSFPSGHASLSWFGFVFLFIYLSQRMKSVANSTICWWWSRSISVITFLWTITVCISRILDFRHFWWDVLVGSIIGFIAGFITVKLAMKAVLQKKKVSTG